MEIHLLDWVFYIVTIAIMGICYEEDDINGAIIMTFFTIVYIIIFYFFDWIDILKYIKTIKTPFEWKL